MNQSALIRRKLLAASTAFVSLFCLSGEAFAQAGLDAMLKRFDANNNGQLDPNEIPSQYRTLIDRAAKQAGMDTNKPISIERLKRAAEDQGDDEDDRRGGRGDRGDRGDRGRGGERGGPGGGWGGPPGGGWGGPPGGGPSGGGPSGGGWGGPGGGWGGERGDRGRDRERERDRERREKAEAAVASSVPGFGSDPLDPSAVLVPGFGAVEGDTSTVSLESRYDERVLRNVDREILGEYDHNRNGVIDRDEWREVPWGDDPTQDDKNRDGRLSREELAGRIARRWGFGQKQPDGSMVAAQNGGEGRRERGERGDRGDRERGERDRGGDRGGENDGDKTRSYAQGLIRSYDKNQDGFLTPDEWAEAKTDVRAADRNQDNRVDANELASHLAQAERRSSGGDRSARRGEPGGSPGSGVFDSAHDRLPKGTPSWFIEKDLNVDGQVAMAEYSSSWTDSVIQDFVKYDANDDGVITPFEAMNPRTNTPPASASASAVPSRNPPEIGGRPERTDRRERRRNSFWGN